MRLRIILTILLAWATSTAPVLSRPVLDSSISSSSTLSRPPVGSGDMQDTLHGQLLEAASKGHLYDTMQDAIQHGYHGQRHESTRVVPGVPDVQNVMYDQLVQAGSRGQLWSTMQDAIQHGHTGPWHESTLVVPGHVVQLPPASQQAFADVPGPSSRLQHAGFIAPQLPPKHPSERFSHGFALPAAPQQPQFGVLESSSIQSPNVGRKRPFETTWYGLATTFAPAQQAHNDMPESSSAPRNLKPGQTFLSDRHQLRAQQAATSEMAHVISPDLTPAEVSWIAKNYQQRDQNFWTLMERRWLQQLYDHAIERGYISKGGQVMPDASAVRPQQQLHEARPVPLSKFGEQHPVHRMVSGSQSFPTHAYAHANDDLEPMQAYRRSRSTVSLDRNFVPPRTSEFTKLQRIISSFKLSDKWGNFVPSQLGASRFNNAIGFGDHGIAQVAAEPNLVSKLSLKNLSNQRLTAETATWKALGARLIFVQDWNTAYALVDGQMLRRAFPRMLEEDKEKLQDGRVAIIKVEKAGNRFIYRLFSVLRPEVIGHVKP